MNIFANVVQDKNNKRLGKLEEEVKNNQDLITSIRTWPLTNLPKLKEIIKEIKKQNKDTRVTLHSSIDTKFGDCLKNLKEIDDKFENIMEYVSDQFSNITNIISNINVYEGDIKTLLEKTVDSMNNLNADLNMGPPKITIKLLTIDSLHDVFDEIDEYEIKLKAVANTLTNAQMKAKVSHLISKHIPEARKAVIVLVDPVQKVYAELKAIDPHII